MGPTWAAGPGGGQGQSPGSAWRPVTSGAVRVAIGGVLRHGEVGAGLGQLLGVLGRASRAEGSPGPHLALAPWGRGTGTCGEEEGTHGDRGTGGAVEGEQGMGSLG